jgi:hypothetical protein
MAASGADSRLQKNGENDKQERFALVAPAFVTAVILVVSRERSDFTSLPRNSGKLMFHSLLYSELR